MSRSKVSKRKLTLDKMEFLQAKMLRRSERLRDQALELGKLILQEKVDLQDKKNAVHS